MKKKTKKRVLQSSPSLFSLAGNPASRSFLEAKGYYDPGAWDYLFSARGTCERARAALALSSPEEEAPSSSEEGTMSAKTPPPPPYHRRKVKVLSCVPGARKALTSKSGLAATLEAAGLFPLDPDALSSFSTSALLPRSIPLARPGAAWAAASAAALGLGGGAGGSEWALKSGGHRGKGVRMVRGAREAAAGAAATAAAARASSSSSLSRWFFRVASSSSFLSSASSSVLQAAVSPQATVGGGRRFYLRVLFVLVAESGGGVRVGGGGGGGEDNKRAAAAAAALPRAYLYRGGIVIAESTLKKKGEKEGEEQKKKESEREAPPPSPNSDSSNSDSSNPAPSRPVSAPCACAPPPPTVPVVNMWLHDPEHVAVWALRDLEGALDGGGEKKGAVAAAARRGAEEALGLALAAAAPRIAEAAAKVGGPSSPSLPRHLSVELLGADFVVTPEGKAALLEINELPSIARLQKGARAKVAKEASSSAAERAFDGEKEAVVTALLRFVAAVSEAGEATSESEAEAARAAGLKPLAEAVASGQRALDVAAAAAAERKKEEQQKKRKWCLFARRLARRLFFESAAGDAAAALLAAVCPRLLVLLAELAARAGLAGI